MTMQPLPELGTLAVAHLPGDAGASHVWFQAHAESARGTRLTARRSRSAYLRRARRLRWRAEELIYLDDADLSLLHRSWLLAALLRGAGLRAIPFEPLDEGDGRADARQLCGAFNLTAVTLVSSR